MSSSVVTVNPQEPQKTVVILMNNDNCSIPITPQTVQNLLATPENRLPGNVKILSSEDSSRSSRPHQEATSIRVVRIGGADEEEDDDSDDCDPPPPKVNLTVHSVERPSAAASSHQPITLQQQTVVEVPQRLPVVGVPQRASFIELRQRLSGVETPQRLPVIETPQRLPVIETPQRLPVIETPQRLPVIETPQRLPVVEVPQRLPVVEVPQRLPEPIDPTPPPISMEELLADISMDHCYSAVPPPSMLRAQQHHSHHQQQPQQQPLHQHGTYTHSTQPMAPELPEDFMASDEDDEDRKKKEEEPPKIDLSPKPDPDLQNETKSYLQIDNMNNDLRNGLSIQNQKKIGRRASEDSKKRAFRLSQDHPLSKPKPPPKQIAQSSKEKTTAAKVSRRESRKSSSADKDLFSSIQDVKKPFDKERKLQVKIESPKQMAKRKPKIEVKIEPVKEEKKPSKAIEVKKKQVPEPKEKEEMDKKKRGKPAPKKEEPAVTEDEESSDDDEMDSDDSDDEEDDEEEGEDDDPEKLWCICRKPHNNRFMICCDKCEDWFHGKCVGVSQATGRKMEETGEQWFCPNCRKDDKQKEKDEKEQDQKRRREERSKKGDSGGVDPPSRRDDGGGSTRRGKGGRKSTDEPPKDSEGPQNSSKAGGKNRKGPADESGNVKKGNAAVKRKASDASETEASKRRPKMAEEKGKGKQESEVYGQESAKRKVRRGVQDDSVEGSKSSKTDDDDTDKKKKNEQEKGRSKLGMVVSCVCGCGQDSQPDWVYFTDQCIVKYANYAIKGIMAAKKGQSKAEVKGDVKVVVIERKSGQTLSGLPAPTTGNLVKWLQQHPSFEAIIPEALPTNKFYKSVQPTKNQKLQKAKVTRSDSTGAHPAVIALPVASEEVKSPRPKEKEAPVSVSNMRKSRKDISFAEALTSSNPREAKDKSVKVEKTVVKVPEKKDKSPSKAKQEVNSRQGPVAKGNESPRKVNLRTRGGVPVKETKEEKAQEAPKPKPRERQSSTSSGPQRRKSSTGSVTPSTPVEEKKGNLSTPSSIRDTVKKQLLDNLLQRVKDAGESEEGALNLKEEDIEPIASQIEEELYNIFNKDTGTKYRSKYRSLIFNIKDQKNPLYRDIVEKRLLPERLVRMAPEELAPKELAEWRQRESMAELEKIKKNELDLLQLGNTYVMKTHKGEQVIENEGLSSKKQELEEAKLPDEQPIMSSVVSSAGDEESLNHPNHIFHPSCSLCQEDLKKKAKEKDSKSSKKKKTDKKRGKKDKKKVTKKKTPEKSKSKSGKKSKDSKKSKSKKKSSKEDKDTPLVTVIEDSFEEEDDDDEEDEEEEQPSSTVVIPSPDTNMAETGVEVERVLWRGSINMPEVASLRNVAYQVSGSVEDLVEDIPEVLNVVGRISSDTVWSYIAKMKKAGNKELIVLRMAPADDNEKVGYVSLYSYLSSRSRFAVVGQPGRSVKDFYLLPLSAHHPIPTVLLPLDGPGFPNERSNLLLGLIVRHRRKRKSDSDDKGMRKSSRLEGSYTPPPHSASFTPPYPSYTPPNSPPPPNSYTPQTPPIEPFYRATRTRKPSASSTSSSASDDLESRNLDIERLDSLSKRIELQRKHLESVTTLSLSPEEQSSSQGISEMMGQFAEPYSPTAPYSPERPTSSPDSTRQQESYSPSQTNSYSPTTARSRRYNEAYNPEKVSRRQSYRKAPEPYHPEVSYSPREPYPAETKADRHHETYSPTPLSRQYSPTTAAQEEAYNQQEGYTSTSYRRSRYREDAYSPSQSLTPPPISHPRLPPAPPREEDDVYRSSSARRFALDDDPIVRHYGRESARSPVPYQEDLVERRRAQEYREYQERYAAYEREAAAYYQTYGRRTRSRAWEESHPPRREWRPPPAPSPPPPSDWLPGESKKKKKKKRSNNEDREPGELSD